MWNRIGPAKTATFTTAFKSSFFEEFLQVGHEKEFLAEGTLFPGLPASLFPDLGLGFLIDTIIEIDDVGPKEEKPVYWRREIVTR